MRTIYLDNAATGFPKPSGVSDRMKYYMDSVGAPINRSVYGCAQDAGLVTLQLRERLKRFFRFPEKATHVILTPGHTFAINMVIRGLLRPGDHAVVSSMEHNAVMRPLTSLSGVRFDRIPGDREGFIDPEDLYALLRPETKLVIMAHASNVSGTLQNAARVGEICREKGIPFVLDGAQSAGHVPVDFEALGLSALCVPGHKGLLGPSGIGALLLTDGLARRLTPIITGGTGSASDSEEQPSFLPDRFESGTMNLPGIYGWEAAMAYLEEHGIDPLRTHELALTRRFLDGLAGIPGAELIGPSDPERRVGVISVDFPGLDNAEAAYRLETEAGILTRCGLHCAPSAHRTLGTFPRGTVRFSLGFANTEEDVDAALSAIRSILRS